MAELTPGDARNDARELLQQNVQKTVAIHTLRKIRTLVDEYDEEQRVNRRVTRAVMWAAAAVSLCLVLALVVGGAALPRLVTGALTWLRG